MICMNLCLNGKELMIEDLKLKLNGAKGKCTDIEDEIDNYKYQIDQLEMAVYELDTEREKAEEQVILIKQEIEQEILRITEEALI